MSRTIKNRREAMAWHNQYDALAPKEGDEAPDFELRDADGENPVRLSTFGGERPAALVLGSFA